MRTRVDSTYINIFGRSDAPFSDIFLPENLPKRYNRPRQPPTHLTHPAAAVKNVWSKTDDYSRKLKTLQVFFLLFLLFFDFPRIYGLFCKPGPAKKDRQMRLHQAWFPIKPPAGRYCSGIISGLLAPAPGVLIESKEPAHEIGGCFAFCVIAGSIVQESNRLPQKSPAKRQCKLLQPPAVFVAQSSAVSGDLAATERFNTPL